MGGYAYVPELQTIKHVLKERNIAKYNIFVIKQFKQFGMARSALGTLSASLCSSLADLFQIPSDSRISRVDWRHHYYVLNVNTTPNNKGGEHKDSLCAR